MSKGDTVYGVFGYDSGGDFDPWLIEIYVLENDAGFRAAELAQDRPARMTETVTVYSVKPLVLR